MGRTHLADQKPKVTGAQLRAARGLLNISAQDLADATKLSRGTVQRAELESAQVTVVNTERIIEVLEKEIIFIPADSEGPGVRLRRKKKHG